MKYCSKCGAALEDDAAYCGRCGSPCGELSKPAQKQSALKSIAEAFMVIGCISSGWALIPLCWTIPMTVKYFRSVKEGRPVGVGFKICTLFFVNLIAGILMLADDDQNS